jgi:hypothetical protein
LPRATSASAASSLQVDHKARARGGSVELVIDHKMPHRRQGYKSRRPIGICATRSAVWSSGLAARAAPAAKGCGGP